VLQPIERMVEKVKIIAKNPLAVANEAEFEKMGVLHLVEKEETKKKKGCCDGAKEAYETEELEKTIMKIGHLLAIGFGEAGAKIIGENVKQGGDINPMMAGQMMLGIFGFCDIRNFTESTEVLQTEVMIFVN
jgi:hypothetical protein